MVGASKHDFPARVGPAKIAASQRAIVQSNDYRWVEMIKKFLFWTMLIIAAYALFVGLGIWGYELTKGLL